MLDALLTGDYDCAATRRTTRKGEPPVRSWFARKFYQIINKLGDTEIVDGRAGLPPDEPQDGKRRAGHGRIQPLQQGHFQLGGL